MLPQKKGGGEQIRHSNDVSDLWYDMVFQRFSYASEDMNNKTQQRQQFKSSQSSSQGTYLGGGKKIRNNRCGVLSRALKAKSSFPNNARNSSPVQRSAQTTYLALLHAF